MPHGSGTFSLIYNFTTEAGTPPIEIAKLDAQFADIATGLSNCILRDGTGLPVASIPFNGQLITGLGNASADTHALNRVTADGRYPQLAAANTFLDTVRISNNGGGVLELIDANAGVNEKRYQARSLSGAFNLLTSDDSGVAGSAFLSVARTGTVVDSLALAATAITVNGVNVSDFARLSAANTFTGLQTISNSAPEIRLNETDAAANNRLWSFAAAGEQLAFALYNDAASGYTNWLTVDRTANAVDSIALAATAVTVNGSAVQTAANLLATILTLDGAGSGLDADLLDGQSSAFYQSATNLTAGTLPDARFPATLPALNGSALTALNAANLASGTIPDARFPATLPAASGVNLTALNASNLGSGIVPDARFPATLPAASGVNLTALNANNLGSGTVPDARFPATLPAASGANLTALNATQLTSGTIPSARVTSIDAACTVNGETVGYRKVPRSTTATTLAVGDVGKCVAITANIAVPNSTFAAGDCVSIYNNSTAALNITKAAGTQYLAGVNADDASISLAARGIATIWFNSATEWVVSGNVS